MQFVDEQVKRFRDQIRLAVGPEVLELIDAPDTEDLALNADSALWIKPTCGHWTRSGVVIPPGQAEALIDAVAVMQHRTISSEYNPILETIFPLGDYRFTAVYPPIVGRPVFSLRVGKALQLNLGDYEVEQVLTHRDDRRNTVQSSTESFAVLFHGMDHGKILRLAIQHRYNIVVAGGTGSGKTKLAQALLNEVDHRDRVIYIEDSRELVPQIPNSLGLLTDDDLGIGHIKCLRTAMRMRPTRLVLGEARGPEVLALLKAWGTGHPGGICTVHANGAKQALNQLARLASEGTSESQEHWIAQAVNLVVYLEEDRTLPAGRKVRQIVAVTGWDRYTGFSVVEL